MGMITIQIHGSFGINAVESFSAEEGGHQFALTRAMQFLLSRMQVAIMTDHELARSGQRPPRSDFGMLGIRPADRSVAAALSVLRRRPTRNIVEVRAIAALIPRAAVQCCRVFRQALLSRSIA
jgi:hypothetical protein